MGQSFNPRRLTFAREKKGISKTALAKECGVTRRTVSAWEAGEVDSPPLDLLAEVLDVPQGFLSKPDYLEVEESAVSFRALSSMTASQAHRALASATVAGEFSDWIDANYSTPASQVPQLELGDRTTPALAAILVRKEWGIPNRPIANMQALLERKGIRIFSIPDQDRKIDAFSFVRAGRPFVFLNTAKSGERLRFDLAHELAHLVLHQRNRLNLTKSSEAEADEFASSFLVPADLLQGQIVGPLQLSDVFELKKHWRVSALAMVERLWRLDLISEWSRRQWIIELSKRGFRSAEPGGISPEGSKLLTQLFRTAREDGIATRDLARALELKRGDVEGLISGLAIASIEGENKGGTGRSEGRGSGHLRAVK